MSKACSFELLQYYLNQEEADNNLVYINADLENNMHQKNEYFASSLKLTRLKSVIKNFLNSTIAVNYNKYMQKYEELVEIKMAEHGIYPIKYDGHNVYGIDVILYDENYKRASYEAEIEANEELGLSPNIYRDVILDGLLSY